MEQLGVGSLDLTPSTSAAQGLNVRLESIDEVEPHLEGLFGVRPEIGVEVVAMPAFREDSAPAAYYQPGSLDGSRPGRFNVNLKTAPEFAHYQMHTLAYHEATPGHHFQISIARGLKGMPFFRKMIPFTAYGEGWALYVERLAIEEGFTTDPYDELGYLASDLFRSVRLVVDTGIHHKKWTREEAIAYATANTNLSEKDIVAEIERYIVIPGQACAYKVGAMEFYRLRELARERLGDRFRLSDFHDVVLSHGALPLGLLETVVENWIAEP